MLLPIATFFYYLPPTYLLACAPTFLPTSLPTYTRTYLHAYLPTYLQAYLPACLHAYLPTSLSIYLPTYQPTYLPTRLPVAVLPVASYRKKTERAPATHSVTLLSPPFHSLTKLHPVEIFRTNVRKQYFFQLRCPTATIVSGEKRKKEMRPHTRLKVHPVAFH